MTTANIQTLLDRLYEHYPDATYELNWETPEEMFPSPGRRPP